MIDETTKHNRAKGYYKRIALAGDTTGAFKELVTFNKLASAETDRIKAIINKKFGSGTIKYGSEIPQPATRDDVIQIDAINAFMKRNPAAEGGRMRFDDGLSAKQKKALTITYPKDATKDLEYVTPLRRKYSGKKYYYVKDPTYSEGRRAVKYPAYEKWLKEQHALPKPKKTQSGIRREPGLLRIAEAFQKADITDDFEYLMRDKESAKAWEKYSGKKQRVYKKGMISTADMAYINQLEKNPADLQFIAESLGEDVDWVLDKLEERSQYVEDVKRERLLGKSDPKYKKPRNDYLKVENWLQKNAKRYANPETFEKALIKRFGTDNQFIKDMKSNKKMIASTYFSDGFKKLMLNSDPGSPVKPYHLKQLISSSLYNYNDKIKAQLTDEIKKIFTSENLPKLRTEARKMIKNNPLFKKFGLDKTITGPFPRVIQAEIGKKLWDDFRAFRHPRATTYEMLKAFEDLVPQEFKGMFNESAKAILDAQQNKWPEAKKKLGIADKIAWDHKVPASIIDRGYADIIEYTKVNPVDYEWNSRFKNAKFDTPINRLITKFENAPNIEDKKKIVEEMITTKNKFSQNSGGYLDEVSINFNEKTGELKFSSSAKPLSRKMDATEMLKKSQQQIINQLTGGDPKLNKFVSQNFMPSGLSGPFEMLSDDLKKIVNSEKFKTWKAKIANPALTAAGKVARLPTKIFGVADLALGYLDYSNNRQKGWSKEDSIAHMTDTILFGITNKGEQADVAGVKKIAMKNGMSSEVFDQLVAANENQNEVKKIITDFAAQNKQSKELIESGMGSESIEHPILAKMQKEGNVKLTKLMAEAIEREPSLKTNLQVQEAGAPIDINVDKGKALGDLSKASYDFVQKRIEDSDLEKSAMYDNTTMGGIGARTKMTIGDPEFWVNLSLGKPWEETSAMKRFEGMHQLKKEDPTMYYKMLLSEGVDPHRNMNIPVHLEWEQKYGHKFGSPISDEIKKPTSYFDGGIAGVKKVDPDELKEAQEKMKKLMKQYKNKNLDWDAVKRSYKIWTK